MQNIQQYIKQMNEHIKKGSFVITKQSQQTQTTETMTPFSIDGPSVLKKAILEVLKENKLSPVGAGTDGAVIRDCILAVESTTKYAARREKRETHYTFPQDWDAAVEAIKDLTTPKLKVGDVVLVVANTTSSCNAVGDVGTITLIDSDGTIRVSVNGKAEGNYHWSAEVRLATAEEIKTFNTPKAGNVMICIETASKKGAGWTLNKIFTVSRYDQYDDLLWPTGGGNGIYSPSARKATAEEIRTYTAPATVDFSMNYENGDKTFPILIGKGYMKTEGHKFTIAAVKALQTRINAVHTGTDVWTTSVETVTLGCKNGINVADLGKLITAYEAFNK